MEKIKDWREFLPRGTKANLAKKHKMSRVNMTRIIEREDVLNHPDIIKEARDIALTAIANCKTHATVVSEIEQK